MGHIFISYSSKDRPKTRALATIFEKEGWKVWWDKDIAPGKAFDRAIDKALDDASCIVVLWSPHSVRSHWVLEEVHEGHQRNILVPALIGRTRLPYGFRTIQYIELTKWKSGTKSKAIQNLLSAIQPFMEAPKTATKKTIPLKKPSAKIRANRKYSGALDGKTIVFTGSLTESRKAHAEKVNVVGANFVNSVSGKTDYLVVGKDPGAVKVEAAKKLGIKKISEKVWLKMLNETYRRTLKDKTIVFTGKLDSPRATLEKIAKKLGAKTTTTISGNTDFLVVGQSPGKTKLDAAEKYDLKIINESLWNEITDSLIS